MRTLTIEKVIKKLDKLVENRDIKSAVNLLCRNEEHLPELKNHYKEQFNTYEIKAELEHTKLNYIDLLMKSNCDNF